ncbi:hypothetical protein CKO51_19355 [Rhodopirellula sp. SM50]|nr:hypothetical protein CKO51_19355 [Rhodopirellula sp. SM50]
MLKRIAAKPPGGDTTDRSLMDKRHQSFFSSKIVGHRKRQHAVEYRFQANSHPGVQRRTWEERCVQTT